MPAMKNRAAHTTVISEVWPTSRLEHQRRDGRRQQHHGEDVGRHFRPLGAFREQPGGQHHEGRFHELGGLEADAGKIQPAARALDLGADEQRRHHQHQRAEEGDERETADPIGREEGRADQDDRRRNQEEDLPVDEVKGVEADTVGHRRGCGQ
jgi:hypothetical protein